MLFRSVVIGTGVDVLVSGVMVETRLVVGTGVEGKLVSGTGVDVVVSGA